ncbi:MAG: hypothetical protein HZB46_03610 [Solirubrobacterales bacterium]|nr:hypothetical protein [Solirubrobacterales bacterium]
MGLTIAGPDRFLASGHPEVGERLPPSLGLLRSSDGGQSWQPVSLLGRADLHVLRASGRHVYGYDAGSETLLASTDGGRTWSARRPSTALIDLALDPRNAEHLVAATPEGLLRSRDAGRTWRPAGPSGTGLLVWSDALYLVGSDGVVVRSRDGGRNWEGAGAFEGRPVAASGHGTELVVATEQGRVLHSVDRARTWRPRLD